MSGARPLVALALAFALALGGAGCAGIERTVGGWFGGDDDAPEQASPAPAGEGEVYFSAAAGLPMHADARGTSPVVGRLALHEKVTRTQLENGYAWVTSATSGRSGWVDNAQLVWRLPAAAAAKAAVPARAPAAPAPAADADSAAPPSAAIDTATDATATPTATPPPATPAPTDPPVDPPAEVPAQVPAAPPTAGTAPQQFDPF